MRVLLRCDATLAGGVGHLVRCLALADAAGRRGWDVTLAGAVEAPLARALVAAADLVPVPVDDDAGSLTARALAAEAQVVHVDSYALGTALRVPLGAAGLLLSSMEDGAFGRRPADVVIDSTLGAENDERPDDGSATVLRGLRFAPLRREVGKARTARARSAVGQAGALGARVLVVMGGTDAIGASAAVASLCAAVATASGRPRIAECLVLAPKSRWAEVRAGAGSLAVTVAEPRADLLALAAGFDLVISAAGTTVWELACVGVPMALVAVAENQHAGYRAALDAGIAVGLGSLAEIRAQPRTSGEALARVLDDPDRRSAMSRAGRRLVDGHGADRIVAVWEAQLAGAPAVLARRATADDADLLFAWRNDPVTRASSGSTAALDLGRHVAWLEATLADPERLLLVVEHAGTPAATTRFDRESDDLWEVSITLAPSARSKGLSGPVLRESERYWRRAAPRTADLLARVRPGNTASQHLFERAGYRLEPTRSTPGFDAFVKPAVGAGAP